MIFLQKLIKTTDEVINESDESGDFKMIVRDIRGNVKYSVILNGDQEHDVNELKKYTIKISLNMIQ